MHKFISVIFWLIFLFSYLVLFPVYCIVYLLVFLWDKRRGLLHQYIRVWALFLIWINPYWKVRLRGKHYFSASDPQVIVSNHQSLLDILVLYKLRGQFKWVAKEELFKIPLFGLLMQMAGYIAIERGNKESARRMYQKASNVMSMGVSVTIFPEGTRSPDGRLLRFKDGAFHIAKNEEKRIQPVVIEGTSKAIPKNSMFLSGRQTIIIKVLPAISKEKVKNNTVDQLKTEVREMIENEQGSMNL